METNETALKFILDMGVSPKVKDYLAKHGLRAVHVSEAKLQSVSDSGLIEIARKRELTIITTDADLAKKVAAEKTPLPSVITIRLLRPTASEQIHALGKLLEAMTADEIRTGLITLERDGHRRCALPS